MDRREEERVTVGDWGKALLCSAGILLLLLLLLLLWDARTEPAPEPVPPENVASAGGEETGVRGNPAATGGIGMDNSGEAGAGEVEIAEEPEEEEVSPAEKPAETAMGEEGPDDEGKSEEDRPALPPALASTGEIAILEENSVTTGADSEGVPVDSRGGGPGRNIGGLLVKGKRLGVILDISESMTPFLSELRREIRSEFADAVFREVKGCALNPATLDVTSDNLPRRFGLTEKRNTVMNALTELVYLHRVDSVYWFCDLQDHQSLNAYEELRNLVWGKEMRRLTSSTADPEKAVVNPRATFRLYILSTDRVPKAPLAQIIKESGGEFLRR